MDQIIRRTRMAERQVARRLKAQRRVNYETRWKQARKRNQGTFLHEAAVLRKRAIQARHEDWEMGPLAPRRDVPITPDNANVLDNPNGGTLGWGSISPGRMSLTHDYTAEEKEASAAWAGGMKHLCIRPGDRVVILQGPYRGQIGEISAIHEDRAAVEIKDLGVTNTTVAQHMQAMTRSKVVAMPGAFPIAAIRLVYPLPRENGEVRDVMIRQLRPYSVVYDRRTRKEEWERVVPGLRYQIPWPPTEDPAPKEHAADTLRIHVEETTFVPTLLRPPMPVSVLSELRNPYSKFRTRHTPEYIAQKEAGKTAKLLRRQSPASMLTPLDEFHMQQRELRKARGQPVLSDDMLHKIGELIARNRGLGGPPSQEAHRPNSSDLGPVQEALEQLSVGAEEEPVDPPASRPSLP